jgi:MFS family permease
VVLMRLWRHADFLKLWAGQTISLLGTQVTGLALALTAALVLQASPAEMGLIGSLNVLPFVLFGLPAGLWVDRVRRRPVLIASDLVRALLLATVPLAAAAGRLSIPQLYVVSFGMGALSVLFRVAYGSYLPSIVSKDDRAEGNARLALAEAIARVAGPGLGGALVQLLTAPLAILFDSATFVVSAVSLAAIGASEERSQQTLRGGTWTRLREGFDAVFRQYLLRPLFVGTTLGNLANGVVFQSGIVVLFGAGVAAAVLLGAVGAINPVAGANINTVRQSVTPHQLLGRVTAVASVGTAAAITLGAFGGGVIAGSIGLRATLVLGGVLPLLGLLAVLLSPVRHLRSLESLRVAHAQSSE